MPWYAPYNDVDEDARFTGQASPQAHKEDVALDVQLPGPSLQDEVDRLGDVAWTTSTAGSYKPADEDSICNEKGRGPAQSDYDDWEDADVYPSGY